MKSKIAEFVQTLSLYDYILFGGIIFFFLLFLILAVIFHQKIRLAITLIITAFLLLITSPIDYLLLHSVILYKHKISLTLVKDLEFSDALVVKGDLNNTSKQKFKECTIYVGVSRISSFGPLNKLYPYVPFRRKSLIINGPIEPGKGKPFKLLIEPFNYQKNFAVKAWGQCR